MLVTVYFFFFFCFPFFLWQKVKFLPDHCWYYNQLMFWNVLFDYPYCLGFYSCKNFISDHKSICPFLLKSNYFTWLPPVAMYSAGQIYIAYLSLYRTLWSTNEVWNFTNLMRARLPSDLISTSCSLEDDKGSARMLHDVIFISLWVLGGSLRYWGHMFI